MNILEAIDADLIEPQRLASSVIDKIITERNKSGHAGRALSARDCLLAIDYETQFMAVFAANLECGTTLTDEDWERFYSARRQIEFIVSEVVR